MRSHAQNNGTKATGDSSHAEGASTEANGMSSHAQGSSTKANGDYSHTSGSGTIADGYAQTVIGVYNTAQGTANSKASTDYAFIIGNGTNNSQRSNALGIKWNGNFTFANGTEITPDEFTQMKSGGSSGSSGSLNIIVNMTSQGQAQSGAPIYNCTTDTKWSELVDAYRNDLEIRLTAKQRIDENSNDTNNIVAMFAWFLPGYDDSSPSSDIDKGTFYFNSIGWTSGNGTTLNGFTVNSFGLSKLSNDEIHCRYESLYKAF